MKYLLVLPALIGILAGCAGSPMAVVNAPGGVPVRLGEDIIIVSESNGVWQAGFRDYMAKGVYSNNLIVVQRKSKLTTAIELVSKCKVKDSSVDPMGIVLHATLKC
jgi:hypothetical protein